MISLIPKLPPLLAAAFFGGNQRLGFLCYTRTDFMPFADSQKRPKFIRYSCSYPVYSSIHL